MDALRVFRKDGTVLVRGDPLVTANTIAKVGKSGTYVYARLTLLRLQPEVWDAFHRDMITAAHVQRLASVPADRQAEAFARPPRSVPARASL